LSKDSSEQRKINIAYAIALYHNDNKIDAQKIFDKLLQSAPDDSAPLLAHAALLIRDKLWSQLNQRITDWSQKHTQDVNTPVTIAQALMNSKDEQARKIAEELLTKIFIGDPKNLQAMSTLAMLLQMEGRNDESAKVYQNILDQVPDNVIVMNNLAWILCEEQGKFKEALELTEKGLRISPRYVDLIDTRGVIYYRLGEHDKAIQDFTACLKLYPNTAPSSISSHFHLARAFAKLGQRDLALEHLNQALDLDSRINGLSSTDLAEARLLLEQLKKQGG
jgi:Tfp pilus assembly protein PilF